MKTKTVMLLIVIAVMLTACVPNKGWLCIAPNPNRGEYHGLLCNAPHPNR